MATARPFAYNIGAPITGTDQVGGLAVGTPTAGFSATGLPQIQTLVELQFMLTQLLQVLD